MNLTKHSSTLRAFIWCVCLLSLSTSHLHSEVKSSWPHFRGGAGLLAVSPEEWPKKMARLWQFKAEDSISSAAVVDANKVFFGDESGTLHCLDIDSGKVVWQKKIGTSIEAPPAILKTRLFVSTSRGLLLALDQKTGKELWKFKTGGKIAGSVNFIKNKGIDALVFGSYDHTFYCLNTEDGKVLWTYETENYINGTPSLNDKYIVFGGCDANLHVVDFNGKVNFKGDAGAYVAASVAMQGSKAYFGNFENMFMCFDIESKKKIWSFEAKDSFVTSATMDDQFVYIGCRDKQFYALDKKNGEKKWNFSARGEIQSSAILCGETLVFGTDEGSLFALNRADGQKVWSFEIGQTISASPIFVSGKMFIGTEDGSFYAFAQKK